ncbi:uncharacterized protein N7484_001789 [Penicillium longicatenatum]|uniref:uncharacterized protein n=1 Tax=Penicillium longicatenatum TaxID=1561947 RepID=UPI0025494488|nr:uncharacterized protein N7484_001789 [Penicillium longicatenatum]KAJ5658140.1 hypothetical protein N7484_001789 [Penicillium longicatenatum]
MISIALLTALVISNMKFFMTCAVAGLSAWMIPQIRQPIALFFRRLATGPTSNLILYFMVQILVVYYITILTFNVDVLIETPPVAYVKIDAKNGTRTRVSPKEYSSFSSRQSQASGLSGDEWERVREEQVEAYYAERKESTLNEELRRAGFTGTDTERVMATFVM